MKFAYVKWLDAYKVKDWSNLEAISEHGMVIETSGILVRDDPGSVAIVPSKVYAKDEIEDAVVVPRPYILELKVADTNTIQDTARPARKTTKTKRKRK